MVGDKMKTLESIRNRNLSIPMTASWNLSEIGRYQGLQELYTRQSPQKLKVLREHAIAQSAVSSNRIEGVQIDQSRIGTVIFGHPALKNRDEEEVSGYRDALNRFIRKPPNCLFPRKQACVCINSAAGRYGMPESTRISRWTSLRSFQMDIKVCGFAVSHREIRRNTCGC